MTIGKFNAGIGALIWHPESDSYLLLKRSMSKDFAPGAWECVTGRVDQGEGFEQALHREVMEETGLYVEPAFILGSTRFYRGKARPENELVGLVYCCLVTDDHGLTPSLRPEIHISTEHDQYLWLTAQQAHDLLNGRQSSELWLLRVIEKAEFTKRFLPRELIDFHRRHGFELDGS